MPHGIAIQTLAEVGSRTSAPMHCSKLVRNRHFLAHSNSSPVQTEPIRSWQRILACFGLDFAAGEPSLPGWRRCFSETRQKRFMRDIWLMPVTRCDKSKDKWIHSSSPFGIVEPDQETNGRNLRLECRSNGNNGDSGSSQGADILESHIYLFRGGFVRVPCTFHTLLDSEFLAPGALPGLPPGRAGCARGQGSQWRHRSSSGWPLVPHGILRLPTVGAVPPTVVVLGYSCASNESWLRGHFLMTVTLVTSQVSHVSCGVCFCLCAHATNWS